MFRGHIKNQYGEILAELGPYVYVNVLVEDLLDQVEIWEPDFELTVWMEQE